MDSEIYSLYYIPNSDYVGITTNYETRAIQHESNGKDITGMIRLFKFEDRRLALSIEAILHRRGYAGSNRYTEARYL